MLWALVEISTILFSYSVIHQLLERVWRTVCPSYTRQTCYQFMFEWSCNPYVRNESVSNVHTSQLLCKNSVMVYASLYLVLGSTVSTTNNPISADSLRMILYHSHTVRIIIINAKFATSLVAYLPLRELI